MKTSILNMKGTSAGEIELNDSIFGQPVNKELLYDCIKMQQANKRAGTAASRNHTMVSGTTAKMYRQKGTGRARHGDMRTNIFVGGGKAFGPHPRDYSYRIPRSARKAALKSALNAKMTSAKLVVLDELTFKKPQTKAAIAVLKSINVKSALIVLDKQDETVIKSFRNIPCVRLMQCKGLNPYDLLSFDHLVITKQALENVQKELAL